VRGRAHAICVCVMGAVAAVASQGAAATVARVTGTGAIGPAGVPQSQVFAPVEGPAREIVYTSRINGVFSRSDSGVDLVAGLGATLSDGIVASVGDATLDEAGCAIVTLSLVGGTEGIYRVCSDGVTRIVGRGDLTTDGRGVARIDFQSIASANGFVAFLARLDDGADAVLRASDGELVEIARVGSSAPSGGSVSALRVSGVRSDGYVGVRAAVSGGRDGLFGGTGGALGDAFVEGEASLVGRVDEVEQARLSGQGIWAFLGTLEDGRSGVFRFDGTEPLTLVEAVLLTNDPIPMRPGSEVRDFPSSLVPSLNAGGDVAFRAVLGGTGSGAAIFATRGGSIASLLFSTRDETSEGFLARLSDPQLADDGSVLFSATPVRGGTGSFVLRGGVVSPMAPYGAPTDLGRTDLRFRFIDGRVRATAEGGLIFGEHDTLVRVAADGTSEALVAMGAPSPIGGEVAELGPAEIDSRGVVYFRGGVAGANRGEGVFGATTGGLIDLVVTNDRVRGGLLRDVVETAVELGGDLTSAERRVGFAGLVGAGGGSGGLYMLTKRRVRRLEKTGRARRGIGEIVAFAGRPTLVGRRQYAFGAFLRDGQTRLGIVARRRRRRRLVVREGPSPDVRLPGRIVGLTIPDASRDAIVFRALSDVGGAEAIFVDDWSAPAVVLASGDPDGGGGVLRRFERPVLSGTDVVVAAAVEHGGEQSESLLRTPMTGGAAPETLVRTNDAIGASGMLHDVLAVRAGVVGSILVRAALRGGEERQALLRIQPSVDLDPLPASQ